VLDTAARHAADREPHRQGDRDYRTRGGSPRLPALAYPASSRAMTDFEASNWCGLFPCPRARRSRSCGGCHDAAVGAMDTAAVQEKLQQIGATVVAPTAVSNPIICRVRWRARDYTLGGAESGRAACRWI